MRPPLFSRLVFLLASTRATGLIALRIYRLYLVCRSIPRYSG
jgi:hypothetical protein